MKVQLLLYNIRKLCPTWQNPFKYTFPVTYFLYPWCGNYICKICFLSKSGILQMTHFLIAYFCWWFYSKSVIFINLITFKIWFLNYQIISKPLFKFSDLVKIVMHGNMKILLENKFVLQIYLFISCSGQINKVVMPTLKNKYESMHSQRGARLYFYNFLLCQIEDTNWNPFWKDFTICQCWAPV